MIESEFRNTRKVYLDVFKSVRRSRILHAYVHTHTSHTHATRRTYTKKSLGSVSPLVAWARRHLFFPRSNNSWGQPFWELAAARSYCSTEVLKLWILKQDIFFIYPERKKNQNNLKILLYKNFVIVFFYYYYYILFI